MDGPGGRLHSIAPPTAVPPTAPAGQVLLAGWGEVAHSVALRASECNDEEWAVKDPALLRCTGERGERAAGGACPVV